MNCRRVEKLIPLYVEGDLDVERAKAVLSHAKYCEGCAGLIAEYEESQRWLRSFAPPRFDDSELYDLKLGVLKEINGQKARAPFLHRLAGHWARGLAFATLSALLLIFGAFAFYAYQHNANESASHDDRMAKDEVDQGEQSSESPSQPKGVEQAPRAIPTHRRRRHVASAQRREVVARRLRNPERAIGRPDKSGTGPGVARATGDRLSGDPASTQEMLRIEIQTSDPNIRIIWFSPKENNSNPSRPITETE